MASFEMSCLRCHCESLCCAVSSLAAAVVGTAPCTVQRSDLGVSWHADRRLQVVRNFELPRVHWHPCTDSKGPLRGNMHYMMNNGASVQLLVVWLGT